ncbi:unnamed protein product, partial [Meganyctiphanes norvegica]
VQSSMCAKNEDSGCPTTNRCLNRGGVCTSKKIGCSSDQQAEEGCNIVKCDCCVDKETTTTDITDILINMTKRLETGCKSTNRCTKKGGVCVAKKIGCKKSQKAISGCNKNKCDCCVPG